MKSIKEIFDSDKVNENLVVKLVSDRVDKINDLTNRIESLLKHCRLQFGITVLLWVFDYPFWTYVTGLSVWFVFFFIASYFYGDRNIKIKEYENYILKLKRNGMLTENNLHLLENFNIKKMRFEK
jgi:hypothetical protein